MYRVLLLDDEPFILNALRRCLTSIDAGQLNGEALRAEAFTSSDAALERCEESEFDLVITDYRMPVMNGVEFLTRLMDIQPEVPRVIISGFADRAAIIAAVNEAQLTRFIEKPWDDRELQRAVITILAGTSKRGAGAGALSSDRQLRRLEMECPGITQVERAEDGGIPIAVEDLHA